MGEDPPEIPYPDVLMHGRWPPLSLPSKGLAGKKRAKLEIVRGILRRRCRISMEACPFGLSEGQALAGRNSAT